LTRSGPPLLELSDPVTTFDQSLWLVEEWYGHVENLQPQEHGIRDRAALADQERGPLEAEIAALHAKGAVVSGDVPFEKPPAHAYWRPALVEWCQANGGTLLPIITKAPDISGPPDRYCQPPDGVRYWPPPAKS